MGTDEAEAARLVERLFACIDGRDWPGLAAQMHEKVVYERPGYAPLVGRPAVLEFYRSTRIVASGEHVIEAVLAGGRSIACWGSFAGTARDGRALGIRFADVYELDDGLVRHRRTFFDAPGI